MSFTFINWLVLCVCEVGVSVLFGNADRGTVGGEVLADPPQSHATPAVTVLAWYSGGTRGFVTSLHDCHGMHCFSLEIWQRIVMSKSVQRGVSGESLRDRGFDARCEERRQRMSKKKIKVLWRDYGLLLAHWFTSRKRSQQESHHHVRQEMGHPCLVQWVSSCVEQALSPSDLNALYLNANNRR